MEDPVNRTLIRERRGKKNQFDQKNLSSLLPIWSDADLDCLGPAKGTDIMTPFPVPIYNQFDETSKAVIRTKEKPSF